MTRNISSREWVLASLIALAAVALVQIPYVLGYALARPGTEFTGILMNPEDSQSYFAKMLQGYDGKWLYTIPFTPEEHVPAFVGGFYLGLGHLARVFGLSLAAMWHLSRVIADVVLFLVAFGFITNFVESGARWTAYLLAIFGSGLGWVLFLLNQPYWLETFPVDFKMPESHLFFSALTFPHVAFGAALIIASLWLAHLVANNDRHQWKIAIGAGIANLALAVTYPFLIYLIAVTLGLYWFSSVASSRRILWRLGLQFSLMLAIPLPLSLYYAKILATNPIFRAWDAQAVTPSPPAPHYLVAYGVMLLLGFIFLQKSREHSSFVILYAWVAAVALLVYAPLNPQRRFVEGVQVPLAILSSAALFQIVFPWLEQTRIFQRIAARPRYSALGLERLLIVTFLMLMSLSNVYVLTSVTLSAMLQQPYPLFRSRAESDAMDWLRAQTMRADVVLGAYETGNYVAARAGNRVVLGHWAETIAWQKKDAEVAAFFSTASDENWRRAMLSRYHVAYVIEGPRELALGGFDPASAGYLEPVYANSRVTIFRVKL